MIRSFKSKELAAFFSGNIPARLRPIESQLSKRLQILDSATSTLALAGLPSNHFEALKGDRKGQYAGEHAVASVLSLRGRERVRRRISGLSLIGAIDG